MDDVYYMQQCITLANGGLGRVSPNPMVGCMIVHQQEVIGSGYHEHFGGAHAEVNAINDVRNRYGDKAIGMLKESTVYVTLEPCSHFGKTPPCADLLIKYQVKRVVIANKDPFPEVNGKGIEKLTAAGITVTTGVCADEAAFMNRRFITRITKQRPYIILKWAQTNDHFFAPLPAGQKWISNEWAKKLTHEWRSQEDTILIGKNTALTDNPRLTNRLATGKNPVRLIIDKNLSIPTTYHLFNKEAKTIIFNDLRSDVSGNIHYVQIEDMAYYLSQKIAYQLYLMDIQSVIIEGGQQLLNLFIADGLWDEARVFTSSDCWEDGLQAPQIDGYIGAEQITDGNTLTTYFKTKPCYISE